MHVCMGHDGVHTNAAACQTFFHAQHLRVFAVQGGGMLHGQVDEFLVVGVLADTFGPGRIGLQLRPAVKAGQHGVGRQLA